MSKVRGNGFGVRFYRRGMVRQAAKAPEQESGSILWDGKDDSMAKTVMRPQTFKLAGSLESITGVSAQGSPKAERAVPAKTETGEKEKALWLAARAGDCYRIRVLVMEGADLDRRDPQGRTAINIATQYNQKDALKTLLAAKEMRYMASLGELPATRFFNKFKKADGSNG